jgi:hypothetical protein
MLSWLALLRKEWRMVKAAPFSFLTICAVALVAMWSCFHFQFKGKLEEANAVTAQWQQTAARWESDANYYKDLATHPIQHEAASSAPMPVKTKPPKQLQVTPKKESGTPLTSSPANAPNGIVVGRDNNGTAIVNNGAIARTLSPVQIGLIASQAGAQPSTFEGITCLLGDQEGCRYAEQVEDALKQAGWHIGGLDQSLFSNHLEGIFVCVSPEDATSPPDGVTRLYNALRGAGVDVKGLRQSGLSRGKFSILVAAHTQAS